MNEIQEILDSAVCSGESAGCSAIVLRDGKELFYGASGYADREAGKKVERDTIFRIYSMTKPVTAAAVMLLVQEGKLNLLDPVSFWLPGFRDQKVAKNGELVPVRREMAVRDLMNMTSGLVYPGGSEAGKAVRDVYAAVFAEGGMTTVEAANAIGRCSLAFHPGESWEYGTSAEVLGALVEAVSGMKFGDFLAERFFVPLGMKDTAFYVPQEKQERLAAIYRITENGPVRADDRDYSLGPCVTKTSRPAFEAGGGGLVSTIDDYARFGTMLLTGRGPDGREIIKPRTLRALTGSRLEERQQKVFSEKEYRFPGYSYGNLMCVLKEEEKAGILASEGEYGWHGMLGTWFRNSPAEKITMIYMEQQLGGRTVPFHRLCNAVMVGEKFS
ncbi:MAG: beta-lactamase family protein [Roseburia sp.]|nr:beta-lactamase family protein [Roseburia sp.]MCM1098166.1 beta-lactamase family protein [Ruminococcus flavefaciens]